MDPRTVTWLSMKLDMERFFSMITLSDFDGKLIKFWCVCKILGEKFCGYVLEHIIGIFFSLFDHAESVKEHRATEGICA